ncbi:MAG: hypothetical protein RIQ52_1541 [Pseudomonadota bacterium]
MNEIKHALYVTAPQGLELLLADELMKLGAEEVKSGRTGVACHATFRTAMAICLWSRLANRVLLILGQHPAASPDALYEAVQTVNWSDYFSPVHTFAVDFTTRRSVVNHTLFGAQKSKDAIVDQFMASTGQRPSVDLERPDVRVNVHIERDVAQISIDLSGDSLHRRGYRQAAGAAPLKENLAAALLLRAGWPEVLAAGGALVDPMCGSGTIVIEAAMMAADIAPGLGRDYYGFFTLRDYQADVWQSLLEEARQRREAGLKALPPLEGLDQDARVIRMAEANAERAGVSDVVSFAVRPVEQLSTTLPYGLVLVNPPYGERMGDVDALRGVYRMLGGQLKAHFTGWKVGLFTGNPELAFQLGVRAIKQYPLFNGAIPCKLLNFRMEPEAYFVPRHDGDESPAQQYERKMHNRALRFEHDEASVMLKNRLQKNVKHLASWVKRESIAAYRVYDADLPEFAVAVDYYATSPAHVVVQEYQPPQSIDPLKAEQRLVKALAVVSEVLGIDMTRITLKTRKKQKGSAQYERHASDGQFWEVREGPCRFWVNFEDYLDTGLFLDHRITRSMIGELAAGRHFLNLFAYTGTATVYAALGGALSTVSVDMSHTYLDWAGRNLALNGHGAGDHQRVQADCLAWLRQAVDRGRRYGLIFLDPPTFSNSKRMTASFDVQRDHPELLALALRLLTEDGILIFSTNARQFRLQDEGLAGWRVTDLTRRTLPRDFERNPRIHYCWRIEKAGKSPA